ncbi:MAG: capsular exopolysaccharide family [Gemmatimonadetes bacterium]|nr:capsular exopolysaccharide family [Gemmatimonadota bacterium]
MISTHARRLPGGKGDDPSLRQLWGTLARNRFLVLGVAAATMVAAALYTHTRRPLYASAATIRIDDQAGSQKSLLGSLAPMGGLGQGSSLETEMLVLRSRRIAETVADSLALAVQLLEPHAPRDSVLRVLSAPRDAPAGVFVLRSKGGGSFSLEAEEPRPKGVKLPPRVQVGVPFQVGRAVLALAPALGASPPAEVRFSMAPFLSAVGDLQRALEVSRPDQKADVLNIAFRSTDARLAAAVPNAVSHTFVDYKQGIARSESHSAVEFLRQQVANYDRDLEASEQQLRAFRESRQVISLKDEATEQVQRLAKLQADHEQLVAEHTALSRLLARVRSAPRGADGPSPYRQLASFPVFLSNRAVQDMLQSLTTLENERADLLIRRTEENADVRGINQRVQEIELQLYQLSQNYLEGLSTQIRAAEQSLATFGAQLQTIPEREIDFARLSRRQGLLADIYTLLQTRLKEAEIRQASEPADVRVIDEALVPQRPVSPKPLQNLVLAAILGLVLGVGAAFGRQAMDTKVRSREDAVDASGGISIIASIPRMQAAAPATNGGGRLRGMLEPGELPRALATRDDPWSPAAEAYRALRTNLTFMGVEGAPQTLVFTSAMPGEGKSTSSANLAITLAQQGVKTVLVDADLRRGTLHRLMGVGRDPGLTHLLLRRQTLDQVVQEVPVGSAEAPLHFIAAGILAPNPAELLGSAEFGRVLEELRGRYEMVIFDAPPLNLVTDAAILARRVDSCVLVTRANFTDKHALQQAATHLHQVDARVAGLILNDISVSQSYYGYGHSPAQEETVAGLPGAPSSNGRRR